MPQESVRAVVWLDGEEARVFLVRERDLQADRPGGQPAKRVRHDAQGSDTGKVRDDRKFFEAILAALENAEAWLLAGPGRTKHDLEKYLDGHAEDLRSKLVAVEDLDQPAEDALAGAARRLFKMDPDTASSSESTRPRQGA